MTSRKTADEVGLAYGRSMADVYELAYDFKDYKGESDRIMATIRRWHPQARTLLEVAAGTGRFLELLRPHFEEVEGLDLSEAMLERAAERLPGVRLHKADMTCFDLSRTFEIVCCLFRSIAYCRTIEGLRASVQAMARHLAPGGRLLIEPFFSPDSYWVDQVTLNHAVRDDLKLAWMYVSEREGTLARLRIHYLAGRSAGVEHFEEVHELGLFSRANFESAFAAAGLQLQFDPAGPTATGLYIGYRPA